MFVTNGNLFNQRRPGLFRRAEDGTQNQTDSQGDRGSYGGIDVVEIHSQVIQPLFFIAQF